MDRLVYESMAELDQRHWWYRARREVVAALIHRKVKPPPGARILEIGCGTGHNFAMLSEFGRLDGLELHDQARALAEKRLGRPIIRSPLPALEGVRHGHYDMIGAFDVIEHIEDDVGSLRAIAERLKPGGKFIATVPAHGWLWSAHDELSHHKRRYSKRAFRRLIESSPLRLEAIGYLNSLLFPLAIGQRLLAKVTGKQDSGLALPPAPLNKALERVFAAERLLIGKVPLTPGLSLFAVASRPDQG